MNTVTLLLFVCLLFPTICFASDIKNKPRKYDLDYAYEDIYRSHFAMDSPYHKEDLDRCIKTGDKDCLFCYSSAKRGRDYLLKRISEDPDEILNITLNNIFNYCDKDLVRDYRSQEHIIQAHSSNLKISTLCAGPVISLYYFAQDKYDRVILERLSHAPSKVIKSIFKGNYEWMYNREDPNRWIRFIEELPDNVMNKDEKKANIEIFQKKKGDYKKFRLMLLEERR